MFFFNPELETFKMFGLSHILVLIFFITLGVLMFKYRDVLARKDRKILRRSIAASMLFLETIFFFWNISRDGFVLDNLPLGVCGLSMFTTSFALWFDSVKIHKLIFYWAITGSLISLIVADMTFEFPHFRFIHYYFNHGFFLMGNLYFLFVYRVRFSYRDMWKSGGLLLLMTIIYYPLNYLLETNYFFLRELPHDVEFMYAWMGDFWVVGFVFSIFILVHLIHFFIQSFGKWIYDKPQLKS